MPSRFQPIQAGTDPSQQLAMINKNFAELDAEGTKKLFYDSTGTPSIFIGIQSDGTSAIRVAKPGVDVTTATAPQLAFNSSQDQLKVVKTGAYTFSTAISPLGGDYQQASFAHGLGFTPTIIAFIGDTSGYYSMPYSNMSMNSGSGLDSFRTDIIISCFVDSTNVYFQQARSVFFMSTTGRTNAGTYAVQNWPIRYYLLQETAS